MIAMKHINNRSTAKAAIFLRTFCLSLLLIGFSSSVFAATYTWDGGASTSNWSDLNNWDDGSGNPSVLPTTTDDVVIPSGSNFTINVGVGVDIQSFTIESGATVIFGFSSPGQTFQTGSYTQNSGDVDLGDGYGTSLIVDNGDFTLAGGSFIARDAQVQLAGDFYLTASGVTFNSGTSTFEFSEPIAYQVSTVKDIEFYNFNHSTGNLSGSRTVTFVGSGGAPDEVITINGTFTRGSRSMGISVSGASIAYGSSATLSYNGTYNVGAEWVTGASNGVPHVVLEGGTLTLTGSLVYEVTGSLTRNAGAISLGSGPADLQYSSATLIYGTGNKTVGSEWPNDNDRPESVVIDPDDVNAITLNLASANQIIDQDLNIKSGTLTTTGTYDIELGGNLTSGTLTTTGSFSNTSGSSYIVMTGNQSQSITGGGGLVYIENLEINKTNSTDVVTLNTGILTISGTLNVNSGILELASAANQVDVSGATFQIGANGTYRTGGKTLASDVSTTFSFDVSSTFEYNGTSGTETSIGDGVYGGLKISNADGLNISGDVIINGTLDFNVDAIVDASGSGNTLTLSTTADVTNASASRYVNGPLQIEFNGTTSKIFPIGVSASSVYRPAVFQYTASPGAIQTIKMAYLKTNPGFSASGNISFVSDEGYYTLERVSGTATTSYNLTLTYTDVLNDTQFDPEDRTTVLVQNGGTATSYTVAISQSHNTTLDSVTAFGISLPTNDLKIAFGVGGTTNQWTGSSSTVWELAGNWSAGIPNDADVVVISGSITNQPVIGTSTTAYAKNISISGANTLEIQGVLDITDNTGTPFVLGTGSTLIVNKSSGDPIRFGGGSGSYNSDRTDFQSGSIVEYQAGEIQNDVYANLNINGSTATGTTVKVTEDLTVNSDLASGTITLNGSSSQSIYGANSLYNLTINNSTGVSLASGATPTIDGTLTLTSGILDATDGTSSLTLINSTSGGDDGSYIAGPVLVNTNSTAQRLIATGNDTRMRVIGITPQTSNPETYTVEFFDDPYSDTDPANVQSIMQIYYWTVSRVNNVNANVLLSWGSNDGVTNYGSLIVAQYIGTDWETTTDGTKTGDNLGGTVTSGNAITAFPVTVTIGSNGDQPLPVELVSFEGVSTNNGITLNWETASEKDSRGFILSRKMFGSSEWEVASTYAGNSALESTNSLTGSKYSVADYIEIAAGETVQYQLEEEDIAGIRTVLETITVESQYSTTIESYNLSQNYPNPFNPSTTIGYELKDNARVNIVVYNALGQAVKTLVNENQNRGRYSVQFNAGGLSSGIYFYRMIVSGNNVNYTDVRKMMLVK